MPAAQEVVHVGKCKVLMVGTIPGFVPDGDRVRAAIENHQPDAIALGVPDADMDALEALVADPTLADGLEADELDLYFLQLIGEWGNTQLIPSPDLHAAHEAGLPLHGIDMSDDAHTDQFTATVKVRHLVQRSSARKGLAKIVASDAPDPYAMAVLWDDAIRKVKPLAALELAREESMAASVTELAATCDRLVVVLHCTRFEGVLHRLRNP